MFGIRFEPFAPRHIAGAVRLSMEAGWPHRPEDWAMTLSVSCGVVALSGADVVGTALCSRFGTVATVNMIIVARACRGSGLGRRLMAEVMALGDACELRLVATDDGLPLYEKLGFTAVRQIVQHQGIARRGAPETAVHTGSPRDLPAICAADLDATGMMRGALLERLSVAGEILLADGGFAILRPFGRGYVVGPVVARDDIAARALISEAASRRRGTFLRVDVPEPLGLTQFAADLGLVRAGGGVEMVLGAKPRPPQSYTRYALASQALG